MLPHSNRRITAVGFAVGLLALPALACGPFFPNQLLFDGGNSAVWSPVAGFSQEIHRLTPQYSGPRAVPPAKDGPFAQTIAVDLADLQHALEGGALTAQAQADLLKKYETARQAMVDHSRAVSDEKEKGDPAPAIPFTAKIEIPAGLPREFELYLRGTLDLQRAQREQARKTWQELLALPAAQRHYRAVWAAFMIGKSYLGEDPSKAIEAFRAARKLAADGASDSLGLASSSFGWEARAELDRGDETAAIHLYLQQHASGDSTALESLAMVCASLFDRRNSEDLKKLAADPVAAPVMTGYLLSRGGLFRPEPSRERANAWLAAIEHSKTAQLTGADRLAWAAYQIGDMTQAKRWIAKAAPDSPITQWICAKLLLRDGKIGEAAASLAKAARAFPVNEQWDGVPGSYEPLGRNLHPADRVAAELGVLELSRNDYAESLNHLLKSGWWLDAAYVAERVLTEDELISFVDHNCPEGTFPQLRHLLARRLTRSGRWKEARQYFPTAIRAKLDAYITAIRQGNDKRLPRTQRAADFWTAAKIARYDGMDLMGTELAPDSFADSGEFPGSDVTNVRRGNHDQLFPRTPDEGQRADSSAPRPDRRWHYRYIAIDHAWAAAQLMPDGTDELASLLCEAGNWVKVQDARAADPFYKALVSRCKNTSLGQEALRLKWLPNIQSNPTVR